MAFSGYPSSQTPVRLQPSNHSGFWATTLTKVLVSTAMLLAISSAAYAAGPTQLLNDTGQTQCNVAGALEPCTAANTGDAAASPRQDGRFGRDAGAASSLTKTGGGAAGFDFTKVCMDGTLACTGAANTAIGPVAPAEWACTQDNVTNLLWSLEVSVGDWTTYAQVTLPAATNAANRCGKSTGWRLPTRHELLSITHYGSINPAIDTDYFPATFPNAYWTSDVNVLDTTQAWYVNFYSGSADANTKSSNTFVRLVRDGE